MVEFSGIGYTPEEPITVGGGALLHAFNERRYLSRLRGPGGSTLSFTRLGSTPGGIGVVDVYRVDADGLAQPIRLFLDPYRPGPNGVPAGFTVDRPEEPWRLARSLVPLVSEVPPVYSGPTRWRVAYREMTIGFVDVDPATGLVDIDALAELEQLMRSRYDLFLGNAPVAHRAMVLADVLELLMPVDTEGAMRGVPVRTRDLDGLPVDEYYVAMLDLAAERRMRENVHAMRQRRAAEGGGKAVIHKRLHWVRGDQ
ncbi:hypothetical protein [Catellatospora tritici]|uniref:hypothetical protein n=1 Tax=Catellatospora tritici TaxID=2851566 RepID=UPI001C2CEE7B|nr:hypothetical protein [Catellatospora tritici]MBV1856612.1 hypothetical protein [Catellatospora tritici]